MKILLNVGFIIQFGVTNGNWKVEHWYKWCIVNKCNEFLTYAGLYDIISQLEETNEATVLFITMNANQRMSNRIIEMINDSLECKYFISLQITATSRVHIVHSIKKH